MLAVLVGLEQLKQGYGYLTFLAVSIASMIFTGPIGFFLGWAYGKFKFPEQGNSIIKSSPARIGFASFEDMQTDANEGYDRALYELGMMYLTGNLIQQNKVLAKSMLIKAALKEHQPLIYMLNKTFGPKWFSD